MFGDFGHGALMTMAAAAMIFWEQKLQRTKLDDHSTERYIMLMMASLKEDYRYPIGLDWNWHGAENSQLFSNSMKMKMGIILGWAHYVNERHFKSKVDIWGIVIPAMLFYQSIFRCLVITVIYKWSVDWHGRGESPP
ncbi:V-type proton ATPase subunit a [Penicillium hetheringtonii]|uniref:V-type proton ATPase subunit a n=1 Tax=Penicillium hetheringtonii TaxID=911720 RepID=A0AAD6GPZ9_9EURO|nr:V-type proton ATPase subunit a [Penicillium hetheringtonii]